MTDYFLSRAAEWDKPEKIKMADNFVNEVLQYVKPFSDWKGLEIGAGTGLVGLQILPLIDSLVCVDTSQAMLDVLCKKVRENDNVTLVLGDMELYTKQDIDFVFSNMTFHHIENIPGLLRHVAKVTKKGAVVAIGDIRTEDGSFHRFDPIPHKGFDTDKLSLQFEDAGFDVKLAKTYHVLRQEKIEGKLSEYEQFILIAGKR
ncbi:MAG: class I SAM-dependent methyltransferase [Paludibacteraceae bacterium]